MKNETFLKVFSINYLLSHSSRLNFILIIYLIDRALDIRWIDEINKMKRAMSKTYSHKGIAFRFAEQVVPIFLELSGEFHVANKKQIITHETFL